MGKKTDIIFSGNAELSSDLVSQKSLEKAYKLLKSSPKDSDIEVMLKMDKYWNNPPRGKDKYDYLDAYYDVVCKDRMNRRLSTIRRVSENELELMLPKPDFYNKYLRRNNFNESDVTTFAWISGGSISSNFPKAIEYSSSYIGALFEGKSKLDYHDVVKNYWLQGNSTYETQIVMNNEISKVNVNTRLRHFGIRPTVKYSLVKQMAYNEARSIKTGSVQFNFGEFLQSKVPDRVANHLEQLYQANALQKTGKVYSMDDNKQNANECSRNINLKFFNEYYYKGKKFVRIEKLIIDPKFYDHARNKEEYINVIYWLSVEPLTWIAYPKADIAITKKIIMSGIPYNMFEKPNVSFVKGMFSKYNYNDLAKEAEKDLLKSVKNPDDIFRLTDIYNYMNQYLLPSMIPSQVEECNLIEEAGYQKRLLGTRR